MREIDRVALTEAVERANLAERAFVVLSDTGDSAAGGATGDANVVLTELLRQPVSCTTLVPIVDEPAALAATELDLLCS